MPDVVDLIIRDHREVERMFEQLRSDPSVRPGLVPVLTTLLTAHSRAEESEVYPAARDEAGESKEVEHSQKEHLEAEQLLAKLAEVDPTGPEFDSVLGQVIDSVTHHVEEEESSVLSGLRDQLSEERRAELGAAFLTARAEHLGEQPGEATKDDLEQQAQNIGMTGASSMDKAELKSELEEQAEH